MNGNDLMIKVHFIYAFDKNKQRKKYISYFLQLEFDDAELLERKPEEEFAGEGQLIASS